MRIRLALLSMSIVLFVCGGCAQVAYYSQAAQGQLEILAKSKPIESVINHPITDEKLKSRLKLVQEIRRFAVKELGLPDWIPTSKLPFTQSVNRVNKEIGDQLNPFKSTSFSWLSV